MRIAVTALLLLAAAMLAACDLLAPSRGNVLADLAESTIVPAYEEFAESAGALRAAADQFCQAPSGESLGRTRDALESAQAAWGRTEAMWVGPVMQRRSWGRINWVPDHEQIEELIADDEIVLDQDRLSKRIGADQRGLQAIEYVLGAGDEALAELGDPRRCQYLAGVAAVVVAEADLIVADWNSGDEDGPYRELFSDVERGDLDAAINDAVFLLQKIADQELGLALGLGGDPPDPERAVEGPAGQGVQRLRERLGGLRAMLVGDGERKGFSPLLGGELTERLDGRLAAADRALAAIGPPLRRAIADDPGSVVAARDAIGELRVTVATEVVSHLGVALGFSDADGDSSL